MRLKKWILICFLKGLQLRLWIKSVGEGWRYVLSVLVSSFSIYLTSQVLLFVKVILYAIFMPNKSYPFKRCLKVRLCLKKVNCPLHIFFILNYIGLAECKAGGKMRIIAFIEDHNALEGGKMGINDFCFYHTPRTILKLNTPWTTLLLNCSDKFLQRSPGLA